MRLGGPLAEDSPQRELSGMGHVEIKKTTPPGFRAYKDVVEHILLVTTYMVT